MKRERLLHAVLAVVGIGALTAYLVACRPAWSPDGSKLLFPYFNPKTEKVGVALFDRETRKTSSLLVCEPKPGKKVTWVQAQWDRAGERAIVVQVEDADVRLHLLVRPVDPPGPTRTFAVPVHELSPFPGVPLPEVDGNVFISDKEYLIRVDLETGKTDREGVEGEPVLVGTKNRIYYLRMVPAKAAAEGEEKTDGAAKDDYELGTVDANRLVLKPVSRLPEKDVGEVLPFFALSPDGSVVAMTGRKEGTIRLLLVARGRLQKSIPLKLASKANVVGNLEWSRDGKTIYVALIRNAKEQEQRPAQFCIGEISAETGAMRVTPLLHARIGGTADDGIASLYFQIALSPDGKTIAASPTLLGLSGAEGPTLEHENDRALYLVDLTTAGRIITKVPIPEN